MKIKMKIKIKSKYFMAMPVLNINESHVYDFEFIKRASKNWQPAFISRKLVLQP